MNSQYVTVVYVTSYGGICSCAPSNAFLYTERFKISPQIVLNGKFGVTAAPVFLDNVACDGGEKTLLDCPRGSRLGLISESCACTTFEDCVEDFGVICPGLLTYT